MLQMYECFELFDAENASQVSYWLELSACLLASLQASPCQQRQWSLQVRFLMAEPCPAAAS